MGGKKQSGNIVLREVPTGKLKQTLPKAVDHTRLANFSPDGQTLAFHGAVSPSALYLWHIKRRQMRLIKNNVVTFPRALVFSPQGALVAESSPYGDVGLWNVKTGKVITQWKAN